MRAAILRAVASHRHRRSARNRGYCRWRRSRPSGEAHVLREEDMVHVDRADDRCMFRGGDQDGRRVWSAVGLAEQFHGADERVGPPSSLDTAPDEHHW